VESRLGIIILEFTVMYSTFRFSDGLTRLSTLCRFIAKRQVLNVSLLSFATSIGLVSTPTLFEYAPITVMTMTAFAVLGFSLSLLSRFCRLEA